MGLSSSSSSEEWWRESKLETERRSERCEEKKFGGLEERVECWCMVGPVWSEPV